jgi:hypothetical protein
MNLEKRSFKVYLSGSHHNKCPEFSIELNGVKYVSGILPPYSGNSNLYEFTVEDIPEGENVLSISFLNKSDHDTVLNAQGNIVNDLLLNIDKIEIDDIDLGTLIWSHSVYEPNYSKSYSHHVAQKGETLPKQVTNCVNLGWNGTWKLSFTSPFYIWLLENM